MKLALIIVVLACLLVAVSFAEPELFDSDLRPYPISKRCCENPPGRDGRDGRNGLDGRDGRNGANGVDGSNGPNGVDGIPAPAPEYMQVYSLLDANVGAFTAFLFQQTSPVATAGMSHIVAPGFSQHIQVANAGLYLVTFSIRATNAVAAVGVIGVNNVLVTTPQYLFTIGAGAANYISTYVSLQAGDRVAAFVYSGAATAAADTSGTPTIVMEVASVLLA